MDAKRYFVPTPHGEVSLVFAEKPREQVLVILHGAGRIAFQLRDWLISDAVLAELPGHDGAPLFTTDLSIFAESLYNAIRSIWPDLHLTIVGESLGSIVALQMTADRIVLLDPPMEPTPEVEKEIRVGFVAEWLKPHLRHSYWDLLDVIDRPVEVLCASRSILSPQAIDRLRIHPNVKLSMIEGGHVLMKDNPQGVAFYLAHQENYNSKTTSADA